MHIARGKLVRFSPQVIPTPVRTHKYIRFWKSPQRRLRFATSRYRYDLNREPCTHYYVFCSAEHLIQSDYMESCLAAQKRFFKIVGNVEFLKVYRLIPLTPPVSGHFTVPLSIYLSKWRKFLVTLSHFGVCSTHSWCPERMQTRGRPMYSNSHLTIWTFSWRATGGHHLLEYLVLDPQSTYRVEMKNRECICPLSSSVHCNFVRDGNRLKGNGACTPPPSVARADFSIMMGCTLEIGNHHSVIRWLHFLVTQVGAIS